jgi:hypothetical protein
VTLTAGAPVQAEAMETGEFHWSIDDLPLLAQDDAVAALTAMLPAQATRRQSLIRVRAIGRTGMAQRAALERAVAAAAPDYARLTLDQDQLATEYEQAALDEIDQAGALRVAADGLWQAAEDPTRPTLDREIAAAALLRLYGYVKDDRA